MADETLTPGKFVRQTYLKPARAKTKEIEVRRQKVLDAVEKLREMMGPDAYTSCKNVLDRAFKGEMRQAVSDETLIEGIAVKLDTDFSHSWRVP